MKFLSTLIASLFVATAAFAAENDARIYELRTYYAAPGKLEDLVARFRNHTVRLFEKHGIVNVGYWTPVTNSENKLVYILSFPSKEARDQSFKNFGADPEWQQAVKTSEANGKLVNKIESVLMKTTDFSPEVKPSKTGTPRLYEIRNYKAAPGKLDELLARFRNHTTGLFKKHGMTQLGYWVPTEAKDGAGDTLIYVLAHKDRQAWETSFKNFRADPEWLKAKSDSEKSGPLTVTNGVTSVLMSPVDFSAAQ